MTVDESSQRLRAELAGVVSQLQQLQSTVAVAVSALRHQNADIDADIARLLQRSVSDKLQEQVDKLEALLRRMPPPPRRRR